MKDITISGKRIRTEIKWLLISFAAAIILNVFSIIKFGTYWTEAITSLHIVLLMSLIIYVILLFFRGLASLLIRFASGRKQN